LIRIEYKAHWSRKNKVKKFSKSKKISKGLFPVIHEYNEYNRTIRRKYRVSNQRDNYPLFEEENRKQKFFSIYKRSTA